MAHLGQYAIGNVLFDTWSVEAYGTISGRGLYAFGAIEGGTLRVLYVGHACNFQERHSEGHHRIDAARLLGMNVLLTHRLDWASDAKLQAVEADFIRALQPPLNVKHNRSAPIGLGEALLHLDPPLNRTAEPGLIRRPVTASDVYGDPSHKGPGFIRGPFGQTAQQVYGGSAPTRIVGPDHSGALREALLERIGRQR